MDCCRPCDRFAAPTGAGAVLRQCGEDRRLDRPFRACVRRHGPGLGDRGTNGGRRLRRQGRRRSDRGDLCQPSAQAGRRIRDRNALVRRREGRPDPRRSGLGGRPGGAGGRTQEAEAVHHPLDGHRGFHRKILLALRNAMGIRHLCAGNRYRARGGQTRRGQLVLRNRGLRIRTLARARCVESGAGERRQGAGVGAAPLRHPGSFLLHPPGAGLAGEDHRARQRPARQHQRHQARRRIRCLRPRSSRWPDCSS